MPRVGSKTTTAALPKRTKTKKITIRPFSKPPALPDQYYETTVATLWTHMEQQSQLQTAYSAVVTLVRHGFTDRLFNDWQQQSLQPRVSALLSQPHPDVLVHLPELYNESFLSQYLWVCQHVLSPLRRPVFNTGLQAWASELQRTQLQGSLYSAWWRSFQSDWESNVQDHSLLQTVWNMWQDLGLIDGLALPQDLEAYLKQSSDWQGNVHDWLDKAVQRTSWAWLPWLPGFLDVHYLTPILPSVLEDTPWSRFMQSCKPKQLDELCHLTRRLPKDGMQAAVAKYTEQQGMRCNVTQLFAFQCKVKGILKHLELNPLKNEWETVVSNLAPDEVAKYLDATLKSSKKLDEMQRSYGSDWLPMWLQGMFVPLASKDVWEAFYRKDLAKRLLWNRVVNIDIEKQVCSLLKAECGAAYTAKMEGMFQDIDLSRETIMVYKQSQEQEARRGVEMDVQILTTGYWPMYPQFPNLNLPGALLQEQQRFDAHYQKKCTGRRIKWQYALGHCIVKANGFNKPYDFVVSLCQALVLLQFETDETELTIKQLQLAVGLNDRAEMERILQSLALGKEGTRILRKTDTDRAAKPRMTVHDDDVFSIQKDFTSNQRRIRINNIMVKETKEEKNKTLEVVSRDRLYLIDAVLVRIMKARKTVQHAQLLPQVLDQLRFPASVADVKQRIESLIEREYMERDTTDRNRYNYLA